MKSMVILGSTGSIGTQALDVARLRDFTVKALTSNSNIDLLEKQIREFKPEIAAVADESRAAELRIKVADTDTKVLGGEEGICAAAQLDTDKVLNSIVGIAGLKPTLAAIEAGNDIALANKETLVAGGELVTTRAKEKGVPCDLTQEWAASVWTGVCAITGIPFERDQTGKSGPKPFSATIDRIDQTGGYLQGNCRFVLMCVNNFRGTLGDEDMRRVAAAIAAS